MQVCYNCRSNQLDGTIFCSECGASLLQARRHETTASLGQHLPVEQRPVSAPLPPAPPVQNEPMFALVILNSGRRIKLHINEDLLIGRKDDVRGIYPDVDLGLDGGYDAGVSRRHAILS